MWREIRGMTRHLREMTHRMRLGARVETRIRRLSRVNEWPSYRQTWRIACTRASGGAK